jgi:hypothetical protein
MPASTFFRVTVTTISSGQFGSSNVSVYRMRSFGMRSVNAPPNVCLLPVEILVNDIRQVLPSDAVRLCTFAVNLFGGRRHASAFASRKAR